MPRSHSRADKSQVRIEQFNGQWARVLGDPSLRLLCDAEEANYITLPMDALEIQQRILRCVRSPVRVVIDAFACVGGDALAMLFTHQQAEVHAVQRVSNPIEHARFERLRANLESLKQALKGRDEHRPDARCHGMEIKQFLREVPLQEVSLLYLDPPWAVGPDPKVVSRVPEILDFLKCNVFDACSVRPEIIFLKLPGRMNDFARWLPGYRLAEHPFFLTGRCCGHVLRRV